MHAIITAKTEDEAKMYVGGNVVVDPLHPHNDKDDLMRLVGDEHGLIIDSFMVAFDPPQHGLIIQFPLLAEPMRLPGERFLLRMDS